MGRHNEGSFKDKTISPAIFLLAQQQLSEIYPLAEGGD